MPRWTTTWTLFAFMVVNFADKTVLGLAAVPIMQDLGLPRTEFGSVSAAFFLLFSLAALGGSLLTRTVRTPVLLLGMALLWSVAQLPMVFEVAGFGTLLATRIVLGLAEGPAAPVAMHHLHGWFPREERALPTSILLFGASAGVAIAAPTLGLVIHHWGWRAAFGVVALVGLLWVVVWSRLGREGPYSAPVGRARGDDGETGDRLLLPYRRILLSGTWLAAACGAFAAYWTVSTGLTWSADYFQQVVGLSLGHASVLITLSALAKGAAMIGYGLLVRRSVKRASTVAARWRSPLSHGMNNGLVLVIGAVATAGFALTDVLWLKVVLLLGPMALIDVVLTVAATAVSRVAPPAQRGVTLGALTGVFATAGFLAPLVMGRVVDTGASVQDGYLRAYLLTAGLVAVAGLVVAGLLRPEQDAAKLGVRESESSEAM